MSEQHMPRGEPSPAAVREALQRILLHGPFDRSPVLSRFLAHVVEHVLTSDAPPLKEFSIGLDVFDRPETFDPRLDTIVRVQARRLRDALSRYYRDAGRHDKVRLDMRKGQYGIHARFAEISSDDGPASETTAQTQGDRPRSGTSLPVARNALVGREAELAALAGKLIDADTRLLSITGVGGSGKTRLALALAERLHNSFPGGVLFLDLSVVTEREVLTGVLADVFEVRRTDGRTLEQALADRVRASISGPVLLVLDNMEGVIEGADVLGALLDSSAMVTVLVTSRIALSLYGEIEFPLAPLAVPEQDGQYDRSSLAEVPSVKLFLMRAAAANPRAELVRDLDALAELCVRLDGLPLAIELVAAQAGTLSLPQMLKRFTGHLDLPQNPARDAPSRQRTLRRVIDSSYELLDEPARIALRRLTVFAGGFTLEAAEAVADATGDLGSELLPAINSLVAMGLVYFRGDEVEPRFAMLETLRTYGTERLNASDETDTTHKAHAAYFVVLAEEGVGKLDRGLRDAWLTRCDQEQDNFRQAIRYLLRYGPHRWALRLGHVLFMYWERREKILEARRLLEAITAAVPVETDKALWAKVSSYVATLASFQGDSVESDTRFSHMLELYRELGDTRGEISALNALGICARIRGDESAARDWLLQGLALCQQIGEPSAIAAALSNLAECDLRLGNTDGVEELLDEAHNLFIAEHDHVSATWCVNHLGDLARAEGNFDKAAEQYARAESAFRRLGDAWGLSRSLADRGRLAIDRGDNAAAAALLLDALAGFESLNHQRGMATVADRMASLALAVGHPELVIRLLAAAGSWRAAIAYSARRDDLSLATRLCDKVSPYLDSAKLEALRDEGRRMSPADVADCVRGLAGSAED
ncbi:MAG TPA: tetratricopeptide repeat protein [Woeseiaceae bacterium]|nr:tetratricopeptide repeat protein [Woeseiaceae bacterium]